MISYSLNREDALLNRVFSDQATGFYVDVGANSPDRLSNTKHFYDKGWRGINIEPSEAYEELRQARPNDINLRLVVSDQSGSTDFHECSDTTLSSVTPRRLPARRVTMPARTLASILEDYASGPIDFLSVDVEGHERAVLAGNDWNRFRPRVVVVGSIDPLTRAPNHQEWEPILLAAGYLFAHYDGINRFFVRQEDEDLLRHFTFPPTALEYVTEETFRVRKTNAELAERCNHLEQLLSSKGARLRIWYNVRLLLNQPNVSGVPRVLSRTLEELARLDRVELRWCVYDPARRRFVEVVPSDPRRMLILWAWRRARGLARKLVARTHRFARRLGRSGTRALAKMLPDNPTGCFLRRAGRLLCSGVRNLSVGVQRLVKRVECMPSTARSVWLCIRRPHVSPVASRPFLFPLCLLIHNLLREYRPNLVASRAAAWLRPAKFRLSAHGGTEVRMGQEISFGAGDVVLNLGGDFYEGDCGDGSWPSKAHGGFKYVSMVYDMIPCKFPQHMPAGFPDRFTSLTRNLLRVADLLLTCSESSRRDLVEFARAEDLAVPPVALLRLGCDVPAPKKNNVQAPRARKPARPFVLTVGTICPHKNVRQLYHVWRRLVDAFGEAAPDLVVAGQLWYPFEIVSEIRNDPVVKDRIHLYVDANDEELGLLYRECLFTVFPSLYEGWGLPIAESLQHGKLCIASKTSSMPEVGGPLADYFDPYDFKECYRLVCRAAFDRDYRSAREVRIRRDYRPTTWEDCARALVGLLEKHIYGISSAPESSVGPARPVVVPPFPRVTFGNADPGESHDRSDRTEVLPLHAGAA